ncbi:MAG: hypothetical protein AB1609_00540 [Bacillota bacterium]
MAAEALVEVARAKLNLALCVLGRRPDGYHELDTVMANVEPADELALQLWAGQPPGVVGLAMEGPEAAALERAGLALTEVLPLADAARSGNLVLRAAAALARRAGRSDMPAVFLRLTKRIPAGAGLGGGSSDAAAALRGLNRLWGLGLGPAELEAVAAAVGADVAFCVRGGVQRARGKGERLEPLASRLTAACLIVAPPETAPTALAYRIWDEEQGGAAARSQRGRCQVEDLARALAEGDMGEAARHIANDLASAACRLCPSTGRILEILKEAGCEGVSVSGSGCAAFGLAPPCEAEAVRRRLAGRLAEALPDSRLFVSALPVVESI